MAVNESLNGSLSVVPESFGGKAEYIKALLNSYGNPLGADKFGMTMTAVNNYVRGSDPLDGEQQSNLIALDVVSKSPEALDYTASALAAASGQSKVDWLTLITGLYNTARDSNIPGVSDKLQDIEGRVVGSAGDVIVDSVSRKIGLFIRNNFLLVLGGVLLLIGLIFYLFGSRR
jgi:hypothetical protein